MLKTVKQYINKIEGLDRRIALLGTIMLFSVSTLSLTLLSPIAAHATSSGTALSPAARISFTFDDSLASTYTAAEPTLATYGLSGTDYAISGCVGMTTVPNTCYANGDTPYMSWVQLQALQADGWEIGSHTVDHVCLVDSALTDPSDCANPAPLTTAQVDAELANSKSTLATYGINATDFAPPYGDFNNNVIAQIAKYYASMRQFKNASNNTNGYPYSDYYLQDTTVLETTNTVASIEAQINTAITNKQWLVLTFHDIETKPSKTPDNYQFGTAELASIAAYVQTKQAAGLIQSVHVDQGLVSNSTNMFANGNFSAGIADGWSTDSPANVTLDTGNNGSYPSPTDSIKFVATNKEIHLFSPKVVVNSGTTYVMKNFLNVASISALTSGEVGFYVDEYNANGTWISGQWLKQENSSFVEDMNFTYKPSSPAVTSASLQVLVTANSGITAYLANSQMFPETSATVTAPTNLVANGTFTAGISDGWTTDDPTHITANTAGNGSPASPTDSISLQSGTTSANGHLFSPLVAVSSTHSYTLSSWLNLVKDTTATTGGEVAYYIDEYNAAGQWISGQYKTGIHAIGANTIGFVYTPSSTLVAKASLQVIVVGNSGIQAYLDNATWYQN
jgi:peptidoglycan/xylan/chitin deacetylase (PgdA/CDA1 family)